jgi:hypothetical protein
MGIWDDMIDLFRLNITNNLARTFLRQEALTFRPWKRSSLTAAVVFLVTEKPSSNVFFLSLTLLEQRYIV